MTKQFIFTSGFVYLIYLTGLINEITEEKYPEELESYRFALDVYWDIWSWVGNVFGIRDTFFNRRVIQISAFTCTCFILSTPFIRGHGFKGMGPRFLSSLGSHPTSSVVSPITSLFLHGSVPHLVANMLGLYVFTIGWHSRGPPIHGSLDNMTHQHLLAFLLAAGAATSLLCCVRSAAMKFAPVSIGFSGSLSALIMYEITQKPERRVGFIFAPERYNVSAQQAGWLVVGFELLLMAFGRLHRMDNFGHLVGLGVGYWYSKIGYKFWESEKKNIEDILESEDR